MHTIADTTTLVEEGIITPSAAKIIQTRAREVMVMLSINTLLCAGILFATGGLIFWLADALTVAICGSVMLAIGALVLTKGRDLYAMFGNASALIGAGLLIGGAAIELQTNYTDIAGWIMVPMGAVIAACATLAFTRSTTARFVTGAIGVMGVAMHLGGLMALLEFYEISGLLIVAFYLYATAALIAAGVVTDVRLLTALAIAPFAQALDTGTFYFHAAYVFYSPESTLSILQMAALIVVTLWIIRGQADRIARHGRVLTVMAFIVANLCALVGSLWGDVVGQTLWGPGYYWRNANFDNYEAYRTARDAFEATALIIHEHVYSVLWAVALAVTAFWSAHTNRRGLFNTSVTFAGIHAYTQAFETFYDEPLAYVIGGLVAIPAAWGLWRLNTWFIARQALEDEPGSA